MKSKFNYKYLAIVSLFYIFRCVSIYSQSDSLTYYLETAVKSNPSVLQRYNEYQAALQKIPQVGSLPDPQLEAGIFLSPMELISGNQVADIKLMQMFPWFGVLKNAKDEMSLMAKARFETFRDAKLQVCYDVQSTWYDLYKVRENIRISEKNINLLKTIEKLTLVKYRSGSVGSSSSSSGSKMSANQPPKATSGMNTMGGGSQEVSSSASTSQIPAAPMGASTGSTGLSNVYQIQIEQGDLENNLLSLINEEQIIIARLNSLLNRPQNTPVTGAGILSAEVMDSTYLTVSASMFSHNPMLGMLEYEQQSLTARKKMQKQMGLPMVGLGVNYTVINKSEMSTSTMNGQDMIMPMVTLTLPIYRKKYKAMQLETGYLKTASEQNYQATANSLQTEYYEALQLYNDAQRRMKLYESQSQLAKKTLDIQIKTYSTSYSSMTDILRTRLQLFDYEFRQVEALTDYNKAIARIKRLRP
jgi:outer membrane protein TolC